ncbi:MAG: hypothetical protein P8Z68_04495, partial [Kineosporiaceae bacterium]
VSRAGPATHPTRLPGIAPQPVRSTVRLVLRTVRVTRYVTPLHEGGSLPGLVEADDDGLYVVKFRGAGQGTAALVAEILVGELARRLGIRVPELVLVDLDHQIARREPDPEVQQLLLNSVGLNLGLDFLPGSFGYDSAGWRADPQEAADLLWFDEFTANVDRTWRNPNLLVWHKELWAIDHGAALVFQHAWPPVETWAARRYDLSQHVLRPFAERLDSSALVATDLRLATALTGDLIAEALALIPDPWLGRDPDASRLLYTNYLTARLADPRPWWDGPAREEETGA